MQVTFDLDDAKTKEFFKQAILEMLTEKNDVLYAALTEIMEDIALSEAIREGLDSETVDRSEVFQVFAGAS